MKTLTVKTATKRTFLAITLIVATSLIVSAQNSKSGFSLSNLFNSSEKPVEVTEPSVIAKVEVDNYSNSLDFVIEQPLEVEGWMTNGNNWTDNAVTEKEVKEEKVNLESWMTNPEEFNSTESGISLEAWMHDEANCWNTTL